MLVNGNEIEILAPAGNFENLKTAVLSGADSVYFGLGNFNARRNAKNFSTFEEVKEAVDFCHLRGKKAHVTLNTLVYDNEIEKLIEEVEMINKAGFDAIIVQDLGVINILKQISHVPLHASTQLSVHNVSDAKKLKEMGFDRVVLSRELSLVEIQRILDEVDVEVEIFMHGALCMSVSGQCYFSSALGERSGNRGLCAGVCRLPFYVNDKNRYNLSLKDACYIDYIDTFAKMGIASLKIEGRMKSNEYVKSVVCAVKDKVEKGYYNKKQLENVFSRSGFTDGYITGKRNDMFGIRSEEDKSYTKQISEEIKNMDIEEEKVKVNVTYDFSLGEKAYVKVTDEEGVSVEQFGPIIEQAKNKPTLKENIEKNLSKFGESIYYVDKMDGNTDDNIFIPVSAINEMRRNAIKEMDSIRLNRFKTYDIDTLTKINKKDIVREHKNIAVLSNINLLTNKVLNYFDIIFVPLFQVKNISKDVIEKYSEKLGVEIPRIYFDREDNIESMLDTVEEIGINKALSHTIGKIYLADEKGFDVYSGFGSNITNSYSIDILEKNINNLKNITLSFENTVNNINKIKTNTPLSVIVYGYLPLMTVRNCPVNEEVGCKNCNKNKSLTDRMGKKFKVKCNGQTSEIFNTYPVCIFDKLDKLKDNIDRVFLFTNENSKEVDIVIDKYLKKERLAESTKGCYFRKLL
ncbi:U32 family peptidase [Anaerofustis sp. NSJ-163]|uniref:U32 family peptidase n=1 Tax=Anaerofustis sp. NSJ-163 TaxID=2944391 RepID=UPI00209BC3B6|nr:U32 family peptidase [Anaerofustis sp. NSJ-163]MCO8194677.1 U32 family peptidase [Anaerofustis sp. NSJ-163]